MSILNKTITSLFVALAFLFAAAVAADKPLAGSSLRGAGGMDDATPNNGAVVTMDNNRMDEEHQNQRHLLDAYSAEYKYQTRKCKWVVICSWEDTDYRWCVDNSFTSSFDSTI